MGFKALVTLDDLEAAVRANAALEAAGFETAMISAVDDARAAVRREDPDLLLLSGGLHEAATQRLVGAVRDGRVAVLGLLEPTAADPATLALRLGLTAALVKPCDAAEVAALGKRLVERKRLQERTGIIGDHPSIHAVLIKIEQMAPVSSTVLVEGASGTGKELVARAIHDLSPRRGKPFIAVNCSALPESLLESELFGHEKGAFTGAAERRLGRFELADSGTIFLDEIGEMSPSIQVKLLRVLEERSFYRVGGTAPIRVDVRVVAATNRGLKDALDEGAFRSDLFYRLNVLSIYLPPLRERRSDIPILVRRFIQEFSRLHERPFRGIAPDAMQLLVDAPWPGNVRQLRNLVESMVVLAPTTEIRSTDIPSDIRDYGRERLLPVRSPGLSREVSGQELQYIVQTLIDLRLQVEDLRRRIDDRPQRVELIEVVEGTDVRGDEERGDEVRGVPEGVVLYRTGMRMEEVERAAIEAALRDTRGNRRKAAEMLGIGERTLYRKLKEYGFGGEAEP